MANHSETSEKRAALLEKVEDFAAQAMQISPDEPKAQTPILKRCLTTLSEIATLAGEVDETAVEERAQGLTVDLRRRRRDAKTLGRLAEALREAAAWMQQGLEPAAAKPEPAPLAADTALVLEFVAEARDHLAAIEAGALKLEENPGESEILHALFRSFHTIKGLAGFLEFSEIQETAHGLESYLDRARDGRLQVDSVAVDVILAGQDFLGRAIDDVQAQMDGGSRSDLGDGPALLARVTHAIEAADAGASDSSRGAPVQVPAPEPGPPPADDAAAPEPPSKTKSATPSEERSASTAQPSRNGESKPASHAGRATAPAGRKAASPTVRVDTAKLDDLLDMVGELVIAQSLVEHDPDLAQLNHPRLRRNLSQMGRVTMSLQKTAMAVRMAPIGGLFQRVSRMARDLARKAGKQVIVQTAGEDTELDRTLAEELADPLLHMVRNALDHGIEPPADRRDAGKPAEGTLKLHASHQARYIVITVSDDGRGLDRERIVAKARDRGLLAADQEPSDADVYKLIFEPGFSTAKKVTEISGRGVGMDVVKKQVQKLNGRVEVDSEPGRGSRFEIKLPLTLAIIEGLIVGVGQERFIVPLVVVHEMLRPTEGTIRTVEDRAEMANVRGHLIPVVRLSHRFHIDAKSASGNDAVLVIAEGNGRKFGLLVDEVLGKQEVVIKPLGETLKNVPGVAAGAILGDGRVGLILDIDGVYAARRAS